MAAPRHPTLAWLVRLRWGAFGGHALALGLGAWLLRGELPVAPLAGIVALEAGSNALLSLRARRGGAPAPALVAGVLAFDVALLTALLALSGGPTNPFTALYLVHVVLATVLLPARGTWAIATLAAAGYGLLFFAYVAVPLRVEAFGVAVSLHLAGMWVAFVLASGLVATFVGRTQAELRDAREAAVRQERLASLATLAAGAAHELATPLGTISVVAKELARRAGDAAVREDAELVRREVERCRAILDSLATAAGSPTGEAPAAVGGRALVDDVLARLSEDVRARVTCDVKGEPALRAPRVALAQVVTSLVRNGLDATRDAGGRVTLRVERAGARVHVVVSDEGPGMAADVLARAGEPFFTTKAPGRGMGLGLFLARSLAEQLGGTLTLDSAPGRGTRATLDLPSEAA